MQIHTPTGRLAGTFQSPTGPGPHPAILLCQGLSGVRNLVLPEVAQHLNRSGFASLRFDYSGFGDSEGAPGWIDPAARARDARFALAWLAGQSSVDPERLGVYGHSYGGAVALAVGSGDRRIRAVATVSGPGSGLSLLQAPRPSWEWVSLRKRVAEELASIAQGAEPTVVDLAEIFPFSPAFEKAYAALKKSQGGTSAMAAGQGLGHTRFYLASVADMLMSHPSRDAEGLAHAAVFMVSGELDDTVPVTTVEPVFAALPGTKQWWVVPGADHNTLDSDPGISAALERVAAWFEQHL